MKVMFLYGALAAAIVTGVCYSRFVEAEAPATLAEWDIPPTGSTRILDFYHMNGPMNYRGWPYYFANSGATPTRTREKVAAIHAPIVKVAHQSRPVAVARPAQKRAAPVAVAKSDTCWHLLIGDLFCKRSTI
jgi:hypothetical protein